MQARRGKLLPRRCPFSKAAHRMAGEEEEGGKKLPKKAPSVNLAVVKSLRMLYNVPDCINIHLREI